MPAHSESSCLCAAGAHAFAGPKRFCLTKAPSREAMACTNREVCRKSSVACMMLSRQRCADGAAVTLHSSKPVTVVCKREKMPRSTFLHAC